MPGPGDAEIANELAKNVPSFDIDAARRAGATDSAIVDELAPKVPNFDVAGARAHFAQQAAPPAAPTPWMSVPSDDAINAGGERLVNSLALGQGTRVAAAVQALLGHGSYADNKARFDASQEEDKATHPTASLIGDITGAVANPINEALAGLGLVKSSALLGAVQGSGAAKDDVKSQLTGIATGGAAGGVLGKGMHYAGQIVQAARAPASAALSAIREAVAQSGGDDAVLAASRRLASQGASGQAMLLDLSPALRRLADHAATSDPTARTAIADATSARQGGMAQRALAFVRDNAGNPEAGQLQDAGKALLNNWAEGPSGFGGLREQYGALPMDRDFHDEIMQAPAAKDALERINLSLKGAGKSDPHDEFIRSMLNGDAADPTKSLGLTEFIPASAKGNPQSYGAVSQLRRVLNQKAGAAFNGAAPDPELGQAYKSLRNSVDDYLERTVPQHAVINRQYGIIKSANEAVGTGAADFASMEDPRAVQNKLAGMTPIELNGYRSGVTSAFIKSLLKADPTTDIASQLTAKAGEAKQQFVQMVFGDEPTFDRFVQRMLAEKQMAQARGVTTGSDSGRRFADMLSLGAGGAGVYAGIAHPAYIPAMLAAAALKKGSSAAIAARAAELSPLLTSNAAPASIEQLLLRLRQQQSPFGAAAAKVGAGAAGASGGFASSLFSQ